MNALAAAHASGETPVDFARDFIPEELTPLSYTPVYRKLEPRHRLRYNQLQALYFNEQIVFFEVMIGQGIMAALLREPWPDGFGEKLREFWGDEVRHSEMFRQLNRRCAPELYGERDFHFIDVAGPGLAALRWATRHPRTFPLFIWLMLLQEERSLHFSRQFIRHRATLEPRFVATYRAHLIDEAGHVRWDEQLLDRRWPRTSRLIRKVNARLLAWMVGEFFSAPKRGQVRVVEALAGEFPELRPCLDEMKRELRGLAANERYQASLYSREIAPHCFARFDRWPEFRVMERAMAGYRCLAKAAP